MYDTAEEAVQKLVGSVVLYDGHPVSVTNADGRGSKLLLYFVPLPLDPDRPADSTAKYIEDPLWDFKTLGSRLGFVEISRHDYRGVVYCSRVPTRHSRQGLDQRTVHIAHIAGSPGFEWPNLLYNNDGLVRTMKGVFRKSLEAFEMLTKTGSAKAVPISRKLTMCYDDVTPPILLYRNDRIGYTEDGDLFKLAKLKQYLKEELVDMEGMKVA
jgi:hypothetical protein